MYWIRLGRTGWSTRLEACDPASYISQKVADHTTTNMTNLAVTTAVLQMSTRQSNKSYTTLESDASKD